MAENTVEVVFRSRNRIKEGAAAAEADTEKAASRIEQIWSKHSDAIGKKLSLIGSGAAKGGGILAIGSMALAAAGPLGALTLAVGAFAAVAAPAFTKPGKPVKDLQAAFAGIQKTMAPLVNQVITLAAGVAKDLLPALGTLAKAGGQVLAAFLKPLDTFIKSKVFTQLIDQFAKFAVQIAALVGPAFTQLLKLLLQMFVQLMPAGVQILKVLLPLFIQIVTDLVPVIVVVANVTAAILKWLTQTKLLKPVLLGLIPVILLLVGSSGIGLIIAAVALIVAGIVELSRNWKKIWGQIKDIARDAWNFLTHGWGQFLFPQLLVIRKTVEFVRDHWRDAWNAIRSVTSGAVNAVVGIFRQFSSTISSIFNGIRKTIASAWNTIWNNTVTRVANGISSVVGFFRGLPGKIISAVGKAGSVLTNWGAGVIRGLLSGMTSVIGDVWTFIKGIPGKILKFLHINSPPDWAIDAGKHIMNGLGIGMTQAKDVMGKAVTASTQQFSAGNLAASVGGGVARWRGLVLQALKMEGLPTSLVGMILTQMQSESGGNPRAINLWDSNAKAGHPSKGLMQTIDSTFRAYHWPGTSWNIYDPLANIAAALNYAAHNRGFGSGPGQVGSGHGYAAGGPASGWAMVGEQGRELVRLPPGSQVYPNGTTESMMSGGGGVIRLEVTGGQGDFQQFMAKMIKEYVRVTGGGNVQTAYGSRGR